MLRSEFFICSASYKTNVDIYVESTSADFSATFACFISTSYFIPNKMTHGCDWGIDSTHRHKVLSFLTLFSLMGTSKWFSYAGNKKHIHGPYTDCHRKISSSAASAPRGGATVWRSWFRHCSTSREVAGSIPDGVIGIFIVIILPAALWLWGRLGIFQKWVPAIFPGSEGGRCVRLTTLPPSCADCLKIWELQPPGTLWGCNRPVQGWLFSYSYKQLC